ncbi:MAG: hypothetical protein ABSH20_04750 [Tepidisphaeraceae bacterium]|jgi:hypothetical protein
MQWLLHGSLTPAVADALVRHEHKVHKLEELGLPADVSLADLLRAVEDKQWDIISNDPAMARDIFEIQAHFSRTIVFLQLAGGDVEQDDAVNRLFARYRRLSPRRLYSVTESRVKIRQLPGATFG